MTYTDAFGFERHNQHCTCPQCNPPCGHHWGETNTGSQHICEIPIGEHRSRHKCACGKDTPRHIPRAEGDAWWEPKFKKRAGRSA